MLYDTGEIIRLCPTEHVTVADCGCSVQLHAVAEWSFESSHSGRCLKFDSLQRLDSGFSTEQISAIFTRIGVAFH